MLYVELNMRFIHLLHVIMLYSFRSNMCMCRSTIFSSLSVLIFRSRNCDVMERLGCVRSQVKSH